MLAHARSLGLALLALVGLAPAAARGPLPEIDTWAVFYGASAGTEALRAPDMLVLEPDHPWQPARFRRPGQRVLAYLSLGEVHRTRPYFAEIAGVPGAIAEPNPDWPDAFRLDPRSSAWRRLVLDRIAPRILARGYDGLFLDTLDTGPYLEEKGKHPGAGAAMAALVNELKARFPETLLVANGGIAMLPRMAPALSALAVESVFTAYRFADRRYAWRDPADARARLEDLHAARTRHGLPILVLEYADPEDPAMRAQVARKVSEAGLVPYVADIGLGAIHPAP